MTQLLLDPYSALLLYEDALATMNPEDNGIKPLIEYRERPLDFIVDRLHVPRETLDWTLNAGYASHQWDGTANPLLSILDALAKGEDIGVESGTGCLAGDTEVLINRAGNGKRVSLRDLVTRISGQRTVGQPKAWDPAIPTYIQREVDGIVRLAKITAAWASGRKTTYTVTTEAGRTIRGTDQHPFLTERGWLRLDELRVGDLVHVRGQQSRGAVSAPKTQYAMVSGLRGHPFAGRRSAVRHAFRYPRHRLVAEAALSGVSVDSMIVQLRDGDASGLQFLDPATIAVHHKDRDTQNNDPHNLVALPHAAHHALHAAEGATDAVLYKIVLDRVVSVERFGEEDTYDVAVEGDPHNFIANGFVVHNTGKSFLAAAGMLWFLACWKEARIFTFAPKEDQLRLYIWKDVTQLWPAFQLLFPSAELTDLRIRMVEASDAWGAWGFPVGVKAGEEISTKASGMHAPDMLLIYEECQGIDSSVIEAGENTSTAPHNLRWFQGNPNHQLDALHLACVSPGVRHVRISALDHPNVVTQRQIVPGAVGLLSVLKRKAKYESRPRLYDSRVRGISPAESSEALVKLAWVQRAQVRWRTASKLHGFGEPTTKLKRAMGVDVANSEGGDEAAIARGVGRWLLSVESFPCPNANNLGTQVGLEMMRDGVLDEHVGVDSVGVGAGCVNELRSHDHWIKALGGGDAAEERSDEEQFNNLRSQMQWALAEDLRLDRIDVPDDPEMAEDLITAQWKTVNGKIVVERKEDLKKRLPDGRSPNKGDAVVYWNWVRPRDLDEVSAQRPVHLTMAQRLLKEMHDLDAMNQPETNRYGRVLRQGT